jgi:hypothetical protein
VGSSKRKIQAAQGDAGKIAALLVKFVEERPERSAAWETHQLPNATTRETWMREGVQKLRWDAGGGNNCPYCADLDGKVVGIEQSFVSVGTTLGAGEESMTVSHDTFHPPVHPGCTCSVVIA